jgi:hypothetical protein
MISHNVTTALAAVLPLTEFCFLERGKMFRTRGDPHGFGLPKGKSIDWASRPGLT